MRKRSSSNTRCWVKAPVVRDMSPSQEDSLYFRINIFALMLLFYAYVMLHWAAFFYVVVIR